MRRRRRVRFVVPLAALALTSPALGACASSTTATGTSNELTVLAAASLQSSFPRLGQEFERTHPHTKVVFSFGGSSQLAQQVIAGAPADVFASASPTTMQQAVRAAVVGTPSDFAANEMTVVTPPSDPGHVSALADLARPGLKLVLCQVQVPCGATAAEVFGRAGLTVHPVSEESDVKAALTKVTLGEADAAVVYVTDARAAGATVRTVPIPAADNASTTYPIATVTASKQARSAAAFVALVLSPQGQQLLRAAGFAAAP